MANYIATDTQLTSIADAIRNKMNIPPLGKNLCNPENLTAIGQGNTTYTVSMTVKWDGVTGYAGTVTAGTRVAMFADYSVPKTSGAITRETVSITTADVDSVKIKVYPQDTLEVSDVQIEQGSSATEYEAYQPTPLEFPNGFVSALTGVGS